MIGFSLFACVVSLRAQEENTNPEADFRNFAFPLPQEEFIGVPGKMTWMSMAVKNSVRLVNGRHDFDKDNPSKGPFLILDRVVYGYLTSTKQLDAVVVLGYHTGGTAWWDYIYVFSLTSGSPKLVGWFQAGSRAAFGLYRVMIEPGNLIVDLFDPERALGDCCSEGFVRTKYVFRNGYFVQTGPPGYGPVEEETKTKRENRLGQ